MSTNAHTQIEAAASIREGPAASQPKAVHALLWQNRLFCEPQLSCNRHSCWQGTAMLSRHATDSNADCAGAPVTQSTPEHNLDLHYTTAHVFPTTVQNPSIVLAG